MLFRTSVHLWILVSLIIRAECAWTTPEYGDTFRFSVDVVNNYIYFEKIGDTSMYFGLSVPSVLNSQYACSFQDFRQLNYSLDPTILGITGVENYVISNQTTHTYTAGKTVASVNIYSFQVEYLPASLSNQNCLAVVYGGNWYDLCSTVSITPSESYSSCGTCDCACETACFGPKPTQCNTCSAGYYKSSTTTCSPCVIQCATCSGGSNTQCFSCSYGYYLQPSSTNCSNSCPSNGYYPDSTTNSCPSCATGCAICSGESNTECSSCSSGYYLQPSSTICLSTCPNGYYPDSTTNSCPSCATECATCSGGSNTECSSCSSGYYLQPSSTICLSTCPNGYYPDSTTNSCPSCPNTTGVYQFGNSCVVLNSSTQQIVEQTGSYANTISATTEDSLIGMQLFSGAYGSTFATALNALHILMLLKYCDVGYPPNVEEFFILTADNSSSSSSSLDVTNLLNFFTKLGDEYPQGTATQDRFQKFGVQSFFLSNIGSFFFIIAALLVIILFLNILKKVIKHPKANSVISDSLLPNFQWNTVLGTILGAQIKLALAWCLQFSNPLVNMYSIINLVIAVVSILAVIAIYIACIFKISWNWSIVREKLFLGRQTLIKVEIRQKKLGILWNSYDISASTGRYFVVFLLLRNTILVAIICLLSNYPLAQCYLLIFISGIYLLVICVGKPFNSIIDTLTVISNEMCLLLEEMIMTVFATNKSNNFMSLSTGNVLGWVMIGAFFLSLATNILCIILTIIRVIVEAIRKRREKKAADLKRADQKKSSKPVRPLEGSRPERSRVITSNEASSKFLSSRINSPNEVVDLKNISSQDLISQRRGNLHNIDPNRSESSTRRH